MADFAFLVDTSSYLENLILELQQRDQMVHGVKWSLFSDIKHFIWNWNFSNVSLVKWNWLTLGAWPNWIPNSTVQSMWTAFVNCVKHLKSDLKTSVHMSKVFYLLHSLFRLSLEMHQGIYNRSLSSYNVTNFWKRSSMKLLCMSSLTNAWIWTGFPE